MNIHEFMQGYKSAWEQRDPSMFAALFHADGTYHNTPFKFRTARRNSPNTGSGFNFKKDILVTFGVLAAGPDSGIAPLAVTQQIASEELFQICRARSTGTEALSRASPESQRREWSSDGCPSGKLR
ncbi:hypothetical protein [Candidatus Aalborgicola defluviihabitans]|uniref:hypothetical protein n=1 Tax=Candidatus Aalborgicola defluviihabitans TaxID=3386187 RepID=UPI0039B8CC3B